MSETCGTVTTEKDLAWWGDRAARRRQPTYVHDEEVQPAPSVGEVGLEAVGHPLEEHLNDKHISEDFVGKLKNDFNGSSSFNVDVLEGLPREKPPGPFKLTCDPARCRESR